MNYRLLSKVLGLLLLLLTGAMAGCLLYAYLTEERRPGADAVDAFLLSIGITFAAGLVLMVCGRKAGREMLRKEAVALVGIGWLFAGLFGALPFLFSTPGLGPVGAFFESVSGFTTTGATVIRDLNVFPRSILLWRALTQWLGGLGILVLFVALLSILGVGSKALFRYEFSAKSSEGFDARIRDFASRLWQIYVGLSVLCGLGLLVLGMTPYDAVSHTFTVVSTGGFSPYNNSIAAFKSVWIELWLVLFMVLGGGSFILYAWLLQRRYDRWQREEETKFYLVLLTVAVVTIGVDLLILGQYESFAGGFRAALFQVVSIMTTTGYATEDFAQWPPFSRAILLLLMFIGGCAGSTAGGTKVSRWIVFFKIVREEVLTAFRPSQVVPIRLNRNLVDEVTKMQIVFFLALAGVTVALGTAIVGLLEPKLDLVSSCSAVMATLFVVGPGLGAVGPAANYADLGPATLLFLSFLMTLGRLEFFAILILFMPSLWRKY